MSVKPLMYIVKLEPAKSEIKKYCAYDRCNVTINKLVKTLTAVADLPTAYMCATPVSPTQSITR